MRKPLLVVLFILLASLVPSRPVDLAPASSATSQGTIAFANLSYGPLYLALPEPRGTVATVCGPAACVTRTSTDFGPDQRVFPDRIADVSARDFVRICGAPLSVGTCSGSVTIKQGALPTLPPTDAE